LSESAIAPEGAVRCERLCVCEFWGLSPPSAIGPEGATTCEL